MTIRTQIINALLNLFSGINGQPPYQSKVDAVYNFPISSTDNVGDQIYLGVYVQNYQLPLGLTRLSHGEDVYATLNVAVDAIIKTTAELADSLKSNLIDDIGIALYRNINLGILTGVVIMSGVAFTQEQIQPNGSAALAGFRATVQVKFLLDPANP